MLVIHIICGLSEQSSKLFVCFNSSNASNFLPSQLQNLNSAVGVLSATICGKLCLTIHHKFNMVCRHVCICTCLCTSSRTRLYFGLLGFARVCDSILITAVQTVFVCPTLSNWYSCSLSQLRTDCWDFAQKSQNPGLFLP